ncbi:hypothetical protein BD0140_16180 [Helicobacter pylori]
MISVKLIDLNQKDFKLRAVLNKRVIGFLKAKFERNNSGFSMNEY